ncbi:hypothetical protein T439DRAFT_325610 [Meredithblackwellia eburnea MCA 4105]
MVSFQCNGCGDTLKKPKLDQHAGRCRNAQFTCIDCNVDFYGKDYRAHTSCISEAEKYQKSVYKGPKKNQQQHSAPPSSNPNSNSNGANSNPNKRPHSQVEVDPSLLSSNGTGEPVVEKELEKEKDTEKEGKKSKKAKTTNSTEPSAAIVVEPTPSSSSAPIDSTSTPVSQSSTTTTAAVPAMSKKALKKQRKLEAAALASASLAVKAVEEARERGDIPVIGEEDEVVQVEMDVDDVSGGVHGEKEKEKEKSKEKESTLSRVSDDIPVSSPQPTSPPATNTTNAPTIPLFLSTLLPTLLPESRSLLSLITQVKSQAKDAGFEDAEEVERFLLEGLWIGGTKWAKRGVVELNFEKKSGRKGRGRKPKEE